MLEVKNISFSTETKKILDDISFNIKSGEHLVINGQSGAGKTTLINILTGLILESKGSIKYAKTNFTKLSKKNQDIFRAKNFAIIFQKFHLVRDFSIYENFKIVESITGITLDSEYLLSLLEKLNIANLLHEKIYNLSVGEAQRAAVIRSLLNKPKWLFCDEPTSSLDQQNKLQVLDLIFSEAKENKTSVIITSHDEEVKKYCKKFNKIDV
jgi:putative ABC transport system ATP-binding protein